MSLLTLLAAGTAIRGIKPDKSPFAMREEALLPQFNSGNAGQFASTVLPHRRQDESGDAVNASAEPLDLPPAPAHPTRSVMQPTLQAGPAAGRPVAASKEPRQNPKAAGPSRPAAPGVLGRLLTLWTGRSQSRRPMVQAEFDLSKVEIVRNDLSCSDLELIPSTPARAAQSAPVEELAEAAPTPAPASGRWTNLTSLLPSIRRG